MKKGLTEIIFILDRSGSMASVESDAIGGFNQFIKEQIDVPGEARFTLVQFDDKYEVVFENNLISDVEMLNDKTYRPRGTTALIEAVCKTIDDVGKRLYNTPDKQRPELVIIAILTDGHENASGKEYTNDLVKEKIEHQQSIYNWKFDFVAAGPDQWDQATQWGLNRGQYLNVAASGRGMNLAFSNYTSKVTAMRTSIVPTDGETKNADNS